LIGRLQRPVPDNTQHSQETDMPPAGFEPVSDRSQTQALDHVANEIGTLVVDPSLIAIYLSIYLSIYLIYLIHPSIHLSI